MFFMKHNPERQKQHLLESLASSGIYDERVLAAIAEVPRERFIDEQLAHLAYEDRALPIGMGQTISQPLIVALMTQALQLSGDERVLEIGTGSGYQTAILAHLAAFVYSIEIHQPLSFQAAIHLSELGIKNVALFVSDGSPGWPEAAPYDRILVAAAAPSVPQSLLTQLTETGILAIPVGGPERQELQVIERTPLEIHTRSLGSCVFVPLVGREGWSKT